MVPMSLKTFKIEILTQNESDRFLSFYEISGAPYQGHDHEKLIQSIQSKDWTAFLASDGGQDIGGGYLNRSPKYQLYRRLNLPEVQDLRVSPAYRRQGVATALIGAAEDIAKAEGRDGLGIAVGLHAGFGAAQRLYVRLGFVPDGLGVTYDRAAVQAGESRPVDDDLALMLLKFF
jgi:GNAT superfamily N-acetyltransferase